MNSRLPAVPETAKLFNASNAEWKEPPRLHGANRMDLERYNGTLFEVDVGSSRSSRCDANIDSAVSVTFYTDQVANE